MKNERAEILQKQLRDVVQKAKEIGLNLSKTCENSLIRAIESLMH